MGKEEKKNGSLNRKEMNERDTGKHGHVDMKKKGGTRANRRESIRNEEKKKSIHISESGEIVCQKYVQTNREDSTLDV